MDHQKIEDKLFEYHDNELTGNDKIELKIHIDSCQKCQETLTRWTQISKRLYPQSNIRQPEIFTSRVMARLEDDFNEEPSLFWGRWWKVSAFSMAALSLFFIFTASPDLNSTYSQDLFLANGHEWQLVSSQSIKAESSELDELLEISSEEL
jgi:anti-sigma factor RsiW